MKFVGNIASDSEVVATADGAITAGKPVVVNADGTVKFAGSTDFTQSVGSKVVYESASASYNNGATFDSNSNRVVVAYRDNGNSGYGTAVVGTVSGSSISFGTPVVYESASSYWHEVEFDSGQNKCLFVYRDDGNSTYGTAIVGTVDPSDNSISFGSATVFNTAETNYTNMSYDIAAGKILLNYTDGGNSNYPEAVVATVSGTSVSFGTPTTWVSQQTAYMVSVYDSNAEKHVIAYKRSVGDAIVATVSGTSVSFGSAHNFEGGTVGGEVTKFGGTFDSSANKVLISYTDTGDSPDSGKVAVLTISGTSLSSAITDSNLRWEDSSLAYSPDLNKSLILYNKVDGGNSGEIQELTLSGTSITFANPASVTSAGVYYDNRIVYDTNEDKFVCIFPDSDNSQYGTARVVQASGSVASLTSENFIGFAKDNVADGAVATIQTANSIARDNIQQASASDSLSSASTYGAISTAPVMAVDTTNNRIVIAGRDANGTGKAIVGTIDTSDDTVSFGSFAQFEDGNNTENFAVAFDSSNSKVVIVYSDGADSNNGKAVVGTVSGTSISYGTIVQFDTNARLASVAFDSNAGKIVIAYADYGNSGYGTAIVGTVSGTDISFGTAQVFKSASSTHIDIAFDSSNNKVVVAYVATHHYGIVGTVSGTSISFGSEAKFADNGGSSNKLAFDSSNNKFLIIYKDQATDDGFGIVGTVSGTSISYGSAVEFHDANTSEMDLAFDTESNKFLIAYKDDGDSDKGKYVTASISGTTPSFGSEAVLDSGRALQSNVEYDSGNKRTVINYRNDSGVGTIKLFRHSGFDEDLTIGQTYFVQTDGTLSTSADDPSVIAGTAISGTDLIVKG